MDLGGQRRSEKFEDRGRGSGGAAAIPFQLIMMVLRLLGVKGTVVLVAVLGVAYFVMPQSLRDQLLGGATGNSVAPGGAATSVCQSSEGNAAACDFSRAILASTEDVWQAEFARGALPASGTAAGGPRAVGAYEPPTLVVFLDAVTTGGCGSATAVVGPFYCPGDRRLYIDPGFYQVMKQKLRAPGDFAEAYVIAHEVGHHVQHLIGSSALAVKGETKNQTSVRVELQADCFAGVWGHSAQSQLSITEEDLKEALGAAHAIGDDALGSSDARNHTHGTSEQRKRWFQIGFSGGDAAKCDTFAAPRAAL